MPVPLVRQAHEPSVVKFSEARESAAELRVALVVQMPMPGRVRPRRVVQLFLVMMAMTEAKEPLIAGRAAIRVLKHHKVAKPIFDAGSFRTEKLFATAIGTAGGLSVRSSFLHGKSSAGGRLSYNAWRSHG